jgi:hypothetical protein
MKPSKKSLKKKADEWFSKYVRYRDGEVRNGEWQTPCITCGVWRPLKAMQAGHFVSRTCSKLRFNEQNVNGQCQSCNLWHSGEQYEYAKQLDLKYGKGTAETLHNQRHDIYKLSIEELEQIIEDAKEYIKELEEL